MNKLLVAFDGSENALRALRWAIEVVRERPSASIHLVTANEPLVTYPELGLYIPVEDFVAMQRAESERVLREGTRLLEQAGVPHTQEVLTGPIGSVVAGRADALGCDGIVMGTRGMGALKNLLMGSVATKVLHEAHVPVTLVK